MTYLGNSEKASPITLIDGSKLIDLLIENNIGVQKKSVELLQLDREAFSKNELGDLEEEKSKFQIHLWIPERLPPHS